MARTFGESYDIEVPLGTTWQEGVIFQDSTGAPVPINHLEARGCLREILDYDDAGNKVYGDSILDLSTTIGNLIIPDDDSGQMNILVPADINEALSPTNTRLQADYDIELYDDTDNPEYVEPALAGTVTLTQRVFVKP